jgi:hypothetical protein
VQRGSRYICHTILSSVCWARYVATNALHGFPVKGISNTILCPVRPPQPAYGDARYTYSSPVVGVAPNGPAQGGRGRASHVCCARCPCSGGEFSRRKAPVALAGTGTFTKCCNWPAQRDCVCDRGCHLEGRSRGSPTVVLGMSARVWGGGGCDVQQSS